MIKRLNYFNHQFLDERDFKDEQAYHMEMRRLHNRRLHFWGIVEGLEVTHSGRREVVIRPGMAIDPEGRELVVTDPITREVTLAEEREHAYVIIKFREIHEDADRHGAGGIEGYNRVTETVEAHVVPDFNEEADLALGRLHLHREGHVLKVDESVRRHASSRLAHGSVRTPHLADGAVTDRKLSPDLIENLRPPQFQLADGSVTFAKLDPGLQSTLGVRGWVRLPFKPKRLRPKQGAWGPEHGEFHTDVAFAYSDGKGARGTMEIPVPAGANWIREFRIAGTARQKVRVQLHRTGWDKKQRKGELTEIMNKEIIHGIFDEPFETHKELDEFHAITVSVWAEGEADIWLVAARFE